MTHEQGEWATRERVCVDRDRTDCVGVLRLLKREFLLVVVVREQAFDLSRSSKIPSKGG